MSFIIFKITSMQDMVVTEHVKSQLDVNATKYI